jgi:hypothetical protein
VTYLDALNRPDIGTELICDSRRETPCDIDDSEVLRCEEYELESWSEDRMPVTGPSNDTEDLLTWS